MADLCLFLPGLPPPPFMLASARIPGTLEGNPDWGWTSLPTEEEGPGPLGMIFCTVSERLLGSGSVFAFSFCSSYTVRGGAISISQRRTAGH